MDAETAASKAATASSPEELSRLLEIELIQKRAAWQQASARRKNWRTMSFLFLFLIVAGGLAAFYFAFTQASEGRAQRAPAATEHP
jgi:uncharacterized membrane protein YukC